MKKQISVAVKNELTVNIENKFHDYYLSEILMPLDYLKRNEIEECLKCETWELFTSCIKHKFSDAKIRASRLK